MTEFVDYIPMRLNDPTLSAWDGRSSRVDPGTYDFEVAKVGFDQSKKGNRTLVVTAKVVAGRAPDGAFTETNMVGRQMRNSYVISDEDFARSRMKAIIEATGAPLDEQGGFTADSLLALCFTADVIEETIDTVDSKTGMPTQRTFTKWNGERQPEGQAAPVHAAPPARAAAATAPPTTPRRPAPPPANGGAPARR